MGVQSPFDAITVHIAGYACKRRKKLCKNNLVELNEKTSLRNVLKGDLPKHSFFAF